MTVDNPNAIDLIAHDPKADVVYLVMVEHRDWGQDGVLLPDLQAKLNTYIAYAEDRQFAVEYPNFRHKPIRFELRTAVPPGPRELEFIDIVQRQFLSPRGIEFSWRRLGESGSSHG